MLTMGTTGGWSKGIDAMNFSRSATCALALAALFGALSVGAAEPIPTSPTVIRSLPKLQPRFQAPPRPELVVGTRLTNPAAPATQVTRFEFIGATVIPVAELAERVASFTGRALTSTEVDAAAEEIAKLYRSRGYPLAAAALASPITGGVARLQIYEGRVASIKVEGNRQFATEAILYPFADLPRGKALTTAEVERPVLLIDDQPGIEVRAQALPGATPGESILVLRATEDPFRVSATFDNDGVEAVGRKRLWIGIDVDSLSGWGDELSLLLMNSERFAMDYGRFQYSAQLDHAKRAGISYAQGKWNGLGDGIAPLDIRGSSSEMQFWLSIPTARSRAFSREWRVWFDRTEGTTLQGATELESGQVKTLAIGLYDASWGLDGTGWTRNFEYDSNFNNLEASDPNAHLGQFRFVGSALTAQGDWQVLTKGRITYSLEEVVVLKQFRVGGPDSVRAYDYAQQVGDSGFDATVEFLAPLGSPGVNRPRLALFMDAGYTSFHDDGTAPVVDGGLVGGVGLGLRFKGPTWHFDIDYAHPVGQRSTVDDDTNGYLWGRISAIF